MSKRLYDVLVAMLLGIACVSSAQAEGNAEDGKPVYDLWCAHCHAAGGGNPGTQMLAITRGEGLAVVKDNPTLIPVYIRTVVRKGFGMMPVFRHTEISDAELEDLIAYLQSDM